MTGSSDVRPAAFRTGINETYNFNADPKTNLDRNKSYMPNKYDQYEMNDNIMPKEYSNKLKNYVNNIDGMDKWSIGKQYFRGMATRYYLQNKDDNMSVEQFNMYMDALSNTMADRNNFV